MSVVVVSVVVVRLVVVAVKVVVEVVVGGCEAASSAWLGLRLNFVVVRCDVVTAVVVVG